MKLSFFKHINKAQHLLCFLLFFSLFTCYSKAQNTQIDSLLQEVELIKKSNDKNELPNVYNEIGMTYESVNDYAKALFYYLKSLRFVEEMGDMVKTGMIKLNISKIYYYQNNYSKVQKLSNEAQQVFHNNNEVLLEGIAIYLNGLAKAKTNMLDSALIYYNNALEIFDSYHDKQRQSEVLNAMGQVYQDKEDYSKSIDYYRQSLAIDRELGNIKNVAISYANIGGIYSLMDDYKNAILFSEKALNLADSIGEPQFVMTTMLYIAEDYFYEGNYKKAYEHLKKHIELKDSIYSKAKSEQLIRVQEEYEAKKKEQKINELKLEKEKLALEIRSRNIIIGLSTGIFLLFLLMVLLYIRQRKAREHQKRAELEQKALRAQMNPHFIFNSLNSIQRMFMEGDYDMANDYMGDFGDLLRIILENSGKLKVSINDEVNTLKLYLDIEKMRTGGMIEYQLNIDPTIDLLNNYMPPLVIQPFVENAIWHGILPTEKKGMITIDIARKDKNTLLCTITDNGIGIEQSKKLKKGDDHKSKGMKITEDRLSSVNSVKAEELPTGGTKITILIPIS